jgi:predicted PurR-regulated permease PerM
MTNPFKSRSLRALAPYFILAVTIIMSYTFISNFGFVYNVAGRFWRIITPFFYGFLLAYIINIPCCGIQKAIGKIKWKFISKRSGGIGLVITLILFILIVVFVLYLVVPYIYRSVLLFIASFPAHYESALQFIDYFNSLDILGIYINVDEIMNLIQERVQSFSAEDIISSLSTLMVVPSAIFTAFLTLISSIYILIEKNKFKTYFHAALKALVPERGFGAIMKYSGRLNNNFKQYIKTQTIDGLILGTIVTIELIIMRSPYALLLGIILGIFNYVPYFGSIVATLIAIVVVGFTQGFTMAVIAAVVLLITQQIDGNVIQPKLMGSTFSLSPLLVIISVTIGGAFAGVLGMIVAIPIVAVLKDILDSLIEYYGARKTELSKPADP